MQKHAIVTAGSKGIGKMVTEKLLEKGYSVTVNFHSDFEKVEQLKIEWQAFEDKVQFVQGDISKRADVDHIVAKALEKFGRVDFLINNAGPFVFEKKKVADYTYDEFSYMIEGNLSAVFYFLKAVVPVMREQNFGRIITYGFQDVDHTPAWIDRGAFSAAKSGLASLTKTIAIEEAAFGITANMIYPGDIKKEMKEKSIDYSRTVPNARTPIGRSGTGEDLARLVAFLCQEDSDMITGSIIPVTGGIEVIHRHRRK